MNGDVTVRDVMTREFVGVSEGDALAGVAELLVEAGVDGAVVLRGATPVGTVGADSVLRVLAEGRQPAEVTAGSVMVEPVPTVSPDRPLAEVVSELATGRAPHLVVIEDGEVVGTLSDHDVVAAQAAFPGVKADPASAVAVTPGAVADDRYSTQSVCEGCGALAESLASVNGQLLCADCREL